ncbi:MAG: cytochrome c [Chloroflexi bacterium]|nr:cytochrome c [Chloroflexota bacterium]
MKVRLLTIFSLLLAGALIIAACGGGGPAATPTPEGPAGDAVAGKAKFETTCTTCHGPDAKGLPGLGKDLTASEFAKGLSNQELVDFLLVGRPASDPLNTTGVDMPPRGGNPAFTDQDLVDIMTYIRTLQQ